MTEQIKFTTLRTIINGTNFEPFPSMPRKSSASTRECVQITYAMFASSLYVSINCNFKATSKAISDIVPHLRVQESPKLVERLRDQYGPVGRAGKRINILDHEMPETELRVFRSELESLVRNLYIFEDLLTN